MNKNILATIVGAICLAVGVVITLLLVGPSKNAATSLVGPQLSTVTSYVFNSKLDPIVKGMEAKIGLTSSAARTAYENKIGMVQYAITQCPALATLSSSASDSQLTTTVDNCSTSKGNQSTLATLNNSFMAVKDLKPGAIQQIISVVSHPENYSYSPSTNQMNCTSPSDPGCSGDDVVIALVWFGNVVSVLN